jgi:predicted SAM-dependent methyltransferase
VFDLIEVVRYHFLMMGAHYTGLTNCSDTNVIRLSGFTKNLRNEEIVKMSSEQVTRLHLGCGAVYLDGYINIDVDDDNGTRPVDLISPIEALSFPENSVDEVRIEHVFEHFPRWMSELLLFEWFNWFKLGGLLVMAVPDFEAMARSILELENEEEKCFKYRHIFGNHINLFSFHLDGFTCSKLRWLLERHGYTILAIQSVEVALNTPKARRDIHVLAQKQNDVPMEERIKGMLRAMELYQELENVLPFIEQYLKKIAGAQEIQSNFWLSRYSMFQKKQQAQ